MGSGGKRMIIFTDLDGTLLDHDSYDYSPARPALTALAARRIPVILCSSKTGPEIRALQQELDLTHWPAIVENGAGTLAGACPDRAAYHKLRQTLETLPASLRRHFTGFGDVSDAEVAQWTGLSPEAARRARDRAFTEPGLFQGSAEDEEAFVAALAAKGVTARHGGRFLTLSFGRTKADGLREVAAQLKASPTVALGDAPNDRDMLRAADIAIIVRNDHARDMGPIPGARRTSEPGPIGWNAAILDLLNS